MAENFRTNIKPENFEQTFLAAFTKIQSKQVVYFNVLLRPENQTRFVEKLFAEISPTFMETFRLPPDEPRSKYLTEIYFGTVLSAVKLWIRDDRIFFCAKAVDLPRRNFVGRSLERN